MVAAAGAAVDPAAAAAAEAAAPLPPPPDAVSRVAGAERCLSVPVAGRKLFDGFSA
jgi:hypothetical protein